MREVELPVSFTVADGAGIEKGTLLKMADLNTAAASTAVNDVIAGIAAQEKIVSNGQTKLAVYVRGDFKGELSGNATTGDPLGSHSRTGEENTIYSLAGVVNLSGNCCLGVAKEDGTDGQTIRYELKPQVIESD